MENTSIKICGEKFDIGCRVVLWDEVDGPGYSFYKFGAKYLKRPVKSIEDLKKQIKSFVFHHSHTYNSKSCFNVLLGRQLSVNFMIDDDADANGYATIYQCLDVKDSGYSQKPLNEEAVGVEICYYSLTKDLPNAYSEHNVKKMKVQHHSSMVDEVHGMKLSTYIPTEAQLKSCIALAGGICHVMDIPAKFPRNPDGSICKTAIKDPEKYQGLLGHLHITNQKIDPLGFDFEKVEKGVQEFVANAIIGRNKLNYFPKSS